jgi:hypothetical protein
MGSGRWRMEMGEEEEEEEEGEGGGGACPREAGTETRSRVRPPYSPVQTMDGHQNSFLLLK